MVFELAYQSGRPPWDIGRAQPSLARLAAEGSIAGRVVDLGCGTGENALYLASRGLEVTGVDSAPTAIARAQAKAAERDVRAEFVLADALEFLESGRSFDVAIDSGFFHVLSDSDRIRFELGLRSSIRPGGRYFMLCFSDRQPGSAGPRRVSQPELRATFTKGWKVDSIVEERFATQDPDGEPLAPRAWLVSLTRLEVAGQTELKQAAARPEAQAIAPSDAPAKAGESSVREASRTSLAAAGMRSAHLILDDPPHILDDPMAVQLLGPAIARVIHEEADRYRTPVSRAIRADVLVRSRYAEERLKDAMRHGLRQYVILGAGLDTFAYRQPEWALDLAIFEVDHPASQLDKRRRLRRAGIEEPSNLRFVEADLEADALTPRLEAAGLDIARPAFVACLGVLIYLSEAAADAIFATTADLPAGSRFVFNFSRPDESTAGPPGPGTAAAHVGGMGEPWRTRFEPAELSSRLRAAGFRSVVLLSAQDINERYLRGRNDGLRAPSRVVLAEATV